MEYTTFVENSCPHDCYCKDVCENCGMNWKQSGEDLCPQCIEQFKQDEILAATEDIPIGKD